MSYLVKSNVLHNKKWYSRNDTISDIKDKEAERLIALGAIERQNVIEVDSSEPSPAENDSSLPSADDDGDLTPKEFTTLKASEQREILVELGYEPGGNEEERLKQYTEWYDEAPDGLEDGV